MKNTSPTTTLQITYIAAIIVCTIAYSCFIACRIPPSEVKEAADTTTVTTVTVSDSIIELMQDSVTNDTIKADTTKK